jgi:hypothetical protein
MNFLARKRENFYTINKFRSYYNLDDKFFPETFLIPEDLEDYKEAHYENSDRVYVSKINKGSQGYGIKLLGSPVDLNSNFVGKVDDMVIQRYIKNPFLLQGKKHDLRLYLAITSLEPFCAYLNDEGLARFCTEQYEIPNDQNLDNGAIHLTNYSQNKSKENYVFENNNITEINEGSKRTLASYWKSLIKEGYDIEEVTKSLKLGPKKYSGIEPMALIDSEALFALFSQKSISEE